MAAPVAIVDKKIFAEYLDRATKRTNELAADVPGWPAGEMILPQLDFMRETVAAGNVASEEDLERINVGVLAVREVEGADPDLAKWLMELDNAFRRYGELP